MAEIRKIVIPIAGYGTRMFPASNGIPKALFPILDPKSSSSEEPVLKPVLQVIMEEAVNGLSEKAQKECEICIVLSASQRELIEKYFSVTETVRKVYGKRSAKEVDEIEFLSKRVTFVEQTKQLGFGHAILCAKDFVKDEPFLVLLGDHVYTVPKGLYKEGRTACRQVVEAYEKHGKSITSLDLCLLRDVPHNGIINGEIVEGNQLKLNISVEKPSTEKANSTKGLCLSKDQLEKLPFVSSKLSNLKNTGQYTNEDESLFMCYFGVDLLTPSVFKYLDKQLEELVEGNELQLRDAMLDVMKSEGMIGVGIEGNRFDTGRPLVYTETFISILDSIKDRETK